MRRIIGYWLDITAELAAQIVWVDMATFIWGTK